MGGKVEKVLWCVFACGALWYAWHVAEPRVATANAGVVAVGGAEELPECNAYEKLVKTVCKSKAPYTCRATRSACRSGPWLKKLCNKEAGELRCNVAACWPQNSDAFLKDACKYVHQ